MPSLFSRSRTTSTANKKPSLNSFDSPAAFPPDEFGRVSSASSHNGNNPTSKKDKKKAKEQEKRQRTTSSARDDQRTLTPIPTIPDGSFLPMNLDRPRDELGAVLPPKEHDYGYLSYERHVVLGLEQIERLVDVVADELGTRGGIATPFIFSTTALDISSSAIRRLIRTFLDSCAAGGTGQAELRWREEARFAGPHELGMCLRWGLARAVRWVGGQEVRGLIPWEHYIEFRDTESALGYPPAHFDSFLPRLAPPLRSILVAVLTLLTRLTANSTTSGHTPPTLSPLFGPLLFGLGPSTLPFHYTYIYYLRATNAMEHLILAFIRWQDTPRLALAGQDSATGTGAVSGSAAALGVPARLKDWIKGYPATLPFLHEAQRDERPQARKGAKTVRVMSVRRNVRMYSPDLVKSASTWAAPRNKQPGSQQQVLPPNALVTSREWDRICPQALKLSPRYSEAYKKRMDMLPNFHPDTALGTASQASPGGLSTTPSGSSTVSSGTSSLLGDFDHFGLGLGIREGDDRFRSLSDLKWGEFETMGFGAAETDKKLQFDLTESARQERNAKRKTLDWKDFSTSGFTRTDTTLNATLQFSTPIASTISSWPAQSAEISKKLKKSQKSLPAFGWDTEPVVGAEEIMEESFVDVFCDLVCGSGWMDIDHSDQLERDCNWALIEFKALPPGKTSVLGGSDPRTDTLLVLFEEFVPLEYRQQLAGQGEPRRRLPALFSNAGKSKQWKQAATLNGRPYVVGYVPRSPSYREVEFEGLLRGGTGTKIISLDKDKKTTTTTTTRTAGSPQTMNPITPVRSLPMLNTSSIGPSLQLSSPATPAATNKDSTPTSSRQGQAQTQAHVPVKKPSRFRLPGGIPVPSPGHHRKSGLVPAEYSSVDFETRLASYSDEEYNKGETEAMKQQRRQSKDDAWVDILVGSHRRMAGQDAEWGSASHGAGAGSGGSGRDRKPSRGRRSSDPDIASMEVAQVLAAVRGQRSPSPPSLSDRADRHYGMDRHTQALESEVDEIETVPQAEIAALKVGRSVEDRSLNSGYEYSKSVSEREEEDEDDALERVAKLKAQSKRMGYFDLHPERRPGGIVPLSSDPVPVQTPLSVSISGDDDDEDDDPRSRLAYDDSDAEDDYDRYGSPEKPTQSSRQANYMPPSPLRDDTTSTSTSTYPQSHYEVQSVEVERIEVMKKEQPKIVLPKIEPLHIQHSTNGNSGGGNGGSGGNVAGPRPPANSKTAALIQMYQERDRAAQASPVISPSSSGSSTNSGGSSPILTSKLPVRAAGTTLGGNGTFVPGLPASPAPPAKLAANLAPVPPQAQAPAQISIPAPAPAPVSAPKPPSPPEIVIMEPPRLFVEDTGRASPARYVHGAPLHNVIEEDEEEEE
ncbi:hypothetical protein AX16_007312 [Volvariella volvacea WC 439]|nr:hypothetical protein AX16_007312 [Volvariella volvacea WC 439]